MKPARNSKGFTFIELVVAMAIMGILGAMIIGIVMTGLSSYKAISTDLSAETQARTALSLITLQIRKHDETGGIAVDTSGHSAVAFYDDPNNPASPGTVVTYEMGKLMVRNYGDMSNPGGSCLSSLEAAFIDGLFVDAAIDEAGVTSYTIRIDYEPGRQLQETVTQRSASGGV